MRREELVHLALIFVAIAFFAAIEALGPILYIFEHSFLLLDVIRVAGHALFHATLILAICSLFGRRSIAIQMALTTIYIPLAYANLLYFRSFGICFPFNMMLQFQQLKGLSQSIVELMHGYDILFLIVPIVAYLAYYKLKGRLTNFYYKLHFGTLAIAIGITLCPVLYVINYRDFKITQLHKEIHQNYAMAPKRTYRGFGLLPSLSYQIWNANKAQRLTDRERDMIESAIMAQRNTLKSSSVKVSPKTNCVIMLLESFSSQAIQREYMPTLYELCNQKTTLYCPKVKQLTQGGKSIGGQLVVMTGLHGLRNSTFVTDFPNNRYPSIATALKGSSSDCSTLSVVSTDSNFWQQDVVNSQLGVEELYGLKEIEQSGQNVRYNKHKWIDDATLFDFSAKKIESLDSPFCSLIVPSNMHSPYTYDSTIDCSATFEGVADKSLHEYLRRAKHLDEQIASFINRLKGCGKYDDTLIVVVSDHHVPIDNDAMQLALSDYIPAIFINAGMDCVEQNERNKDVVFCHSQLYPTVLQLMGLISEEYVGLFPPMTDIEATVEFDFERCDYAATTNEQLKLVYDLGELIVRSSYFGTVRD